MTLRIARTLVQCRALRAMANEVGWSRGTLDGAQNIFKNLKIILNVSRRTSRKVNNQ